MSIEPSTDPTDYEFHHRIRIRFVETDAMGIVHHSNYLVYFEEARVAFLADIGHPFTEWRAAGLESPVLESFVRYRQPVEFDEVITVHVVMGAVTRTTFQVAYLVTASLGDEHDHVRAQAVTVHGCINERGRPVRLPSWINEDANGTSEPDNEATGPPAKSNARRTGLAR